MAVDSTSRCTIIINLTTIISIAGNFGDLPKMQFTEFTGYNILAGNLTDRIAGYVTHTRINRNPSLEFGSVLLNYI